MVEEVETSKVLEELSRNNTAAANGGSDRQRGGGSAWLIVILLLIPLLAAAAVLGYQQWTLYLRLNLLATRNNQLLETIQAGDARLAALETAGSPDNPPTQVAIDSLFQDFNSRLQRLDLAIDELRERTLTSPVEDDGALQLVEAEHLLRIANRHLQLTEDVATTIRLLESADRLLLDAGDSRVIPARETLAGELAQLRSVSEVDVDGLYLRLTALRDQVRELNIAASIGSSYQQQLAQARQRDDAESNQQQNSLLDSGLNFFGSIFVWREWDSSPEIVQPSRELVTVKQTIDLMLEQAQLAVLTRRPSVYTQNLQSVRELITGYDAESVPGTSVILVELDSLLDHELAPELPDISQSLRQVRQLSARQPVNADPVPQ